MLLETRANPDGTQTVTFRTSGTSGFYDDGGFVDNSGTYTETGELIVKGYSPQDPDKDLLSLKADFTLDFTDGRGQVSGSKRLPSPLANRVNVDRDFDLL